MNIEDLPHYIDHTIVYEDETEQTYKFFLTINRDAFGQWSCGYVRFSTEEESEMVIPELVTNSSKNLAEAATRMKAKLERFHKE